MRRGSRTAEEDRTRFRGLRFEAREGGSEQGSPEAARGAAQESRAGRSDGAGAKPFAAGPSVLQSSSTRYSPSLSDAYQMNPADIYDPTGRCAPSRCSGCLPVSLCASCDDDFVKTSLRCTPPFPGS